MSKTRINDLNHYTSEAQLELRGKIGHQILLADEKVLVVVDVVVFRVLDQHPERLGGSTVHAVVPPED